MKKLLIIAVLVAGSFAGMAQKNEGFKIEGGINVAIPAHNASGVSIGAGVDLLAKYGISENFAITGDVGYTALFLKNNAKPSTESLIPIRVGLRYFPTSSFYIAGKGGIGIFAYNGSNATYTAYSFGAGYMISPKLDLGLTYDGYSKSGSSTGYVNVRLGYAFGN
jgi:hypothetical protein